MLIIGVKMPHSICQFGVNRKESTKILEKLSVIYDRSVVLNFKGFNDQPVNFKKFLSGGCARIPLPPTPKNLIGDAQLPAHESRLVPDLFQD